MDRNIEKLVNIYDPSDLIDEIDNINNQLLKEYENREKILNKYQILNNNYENLKSKYEDLDRKYNNLRQSKLGRLIIKYWKLKKVLKKNRGEND